METYIIDGPDVLIPSHRYKTPKGEISMIAPSRISSHTWEIYCISEPALFEDVERYDTKEEAEARIRELLE